MYGGNLFTSFCFLSGEAPFDETARLLASDADAA